jgi:ATP-dependent exoDNAse (exonuclease V) beta subunit
VAEVLPFLIPSPIVEPTLPPDAEARRQALDIRRSFIVEAPAGSGKTGLLIQRFLKLLADESVTTPEQVLAVTFTNKAAAELRDRVLIQLESARRTSTRPDPTAPVLSDFDQQTRALALAVLKRDQQLGWSLLDRPSHLQLRTIDSVCAEIARTLPVLSGSGGRLTPTTDAKPLHRQAARRTLLLLGGGDQAFDLALRDLLLHRDGNLADCETLIADMLGLRDQWGELIPINHAQLTDLWLDANVLPRLERALERAICSTLARLEGTFPADVLAELTELASELGSLDGHRGKLSPVALCAGRTQPPGALIADVDHWGALISLLLTGSSEWRKSFNTNHVGIELQRHHKVRLKGLMEQINHRADLLAALGNVRLLPPSRYPANQWAVAKSLFRVLSRALVELQFVFAERDQCDFTELGLLARHALEAEGGPDDLAAAAGARLQHLLVDEMQDTSTSQYQLIERLTASWDGHSQTVFLVGDPRQSIYLFRQARVERFIRALETQQLGDLRLTPLRLSANFRSQRTLVEQFNEDFSRIFPQSTASALNPRSLPYTRAQPTLAASPDAAGAVWHTQTLPASAPGRTPAQIKQHQAGLNAREILRVARDWLARPLPPGRSKPWSVAVLVRSRNHLDEIVSALRRNPDIPFRAVEIEALNQRQEILDLTALTRALLHPADRVAALAILRAPWCGLSLADLHALTGADDPSLKTHSIARLMEDRGHLLPDDSCQRMTRVWSVLQAATSQRTHFTTAQLVERAWRSLGGDSWLTAAGLSNARRFLQLLDELEAPSIGIDLAVLEDRLHRLYAEPEPIPAGIPFVELLTIHKAKGLEWDVVLVPALERRAANDRARLLTWSEVDAEADTPASPDTSAGDDATHIMLAPIAAKGEDVDALTHWLNSIRRAREAAERKRLFYVACTRAREELHLFAVPQLTAKETLKPAADSLLNAAWEAAMPFFAQTVIPAVIEIVPETAEPAAFASAASAPTSGPTLERLPPSFDPNACFDLARAQKLPSGEPDSAANSSQTFSRPEGSFAARSFGNVVHACLDTLSKRVLSGTPTTALLAEIPSWTPRIAAMLRADGLPRASVERLAREARISLENVLSDGDGLWLLASHSHAASEYAITAWPSPSSTGNDTSTRAASIRIDRLFQAGAEPRAPGEDYLWIVDYKTTTHGPQELSDFLSKQRAAYAPQLEAYARILAPARSKSLSEVRLALYFPAIPSLTWWQPLTTTH